MSEDEEKEPLMKDQVHSRWFLICKGSNSRDRHEHARRTVCFLCGDYIPRSQQNKTHRNKRVPVWRDEKGDLKRNIFKQIETEDLKADDCIIPYVVDATCWRAALEAARTVDGTLNLRSEVKREIGLYRKAGRECVEGRPCYFCRKVEAYCSDYTLIYTRSVNLMERKQMSSAELSAAAEAEIDAGESRRSGGGRKVNSPSKLTAGITVQIAAYLRLT